MEPEPVVDDIAQSIFWNRVHGVKTVKVVVNPTTMGCIDATIFDRYQVLIVDKEFRTLFLGVPVECDPKLDVAWRVVDEFS